MDRIVHVAAHVPSSQADSGRKLTLNAIQSTPAKTAGRSDVDLDVDVTNESAKTFDLSDQEFLVYAEGDFFGPPPA